MTGSGHWFEPLADHLGRAYLRYSFTRGTENEVDFLVAALGLAPGQRVLDVGCGPGRHSHALARRGVEVVGVDISARFVELAREDAPPGATFVRADARALPDLGAFDAVISLCQGGFGLAAGPGSSWDADVTVFEQIVGAVGSGGGVAVSAFSAYFQVRVLGDGDDFDADQGVNHERMTVRDEAGVDVEHDAWTTCFTPRELRLMARHAGLVDVEVHSVTPSRYRRNRPNLDEPELLLIGRRPPR